MGVPMLLGSLLYSTVGTSSFLWKVCTTYQSTWHNTPRPKKKYEYRRTQKTSDNREVGREATRQWEVNCSYRTVFSTSRTYLKRDFVSRCYWQDVWKIHYKPQNVFTSFASHSASAYLLEEIEEVSCSFRPCLREDVPLDVPCAILVQNIWTTFERGLPLPQCAYVCENMSHKLISFNINTRHNSTPIVHPLSRHPNTLPHGCHKYDSVNDSYHDSAAISEQHRLLTRG
jgi:hypothetical protein